MRKRLLSLLLIAALTIGIIPQSSVLAGNANETINPDYNCEKQLPSESSRFSVAHVQNYGASSSNGTRRQLEVVVTLENFNNATDYVYALVMRAQDYSTALSGGPAASALDGTRYFRLPVPTGGTSYYGMGGQRVVNGQAGDKLVLPIAQAGGTTGQQNNATIGTGGTLSPINMPLAAAPSSGNNYYDKYVLVVFAADRTGATDQTRPDGNFYIDYFYMDSEGYVYTPSYGVRYNGNNPAGNTNVTNLPTNNDTGSGNGYNRNTFLKRASWNPNSLGSGKPGDMILSDTIPTRTGYKFVGWTTEARTPLAEGEAAPTDKNFYPAKGTFQEPAALNTIYDLYALWQVVPVKFSHTSTDVTKYTITQEGSDWVIDWLSPLPQVGVSFSTGPIRYAQPGATGAEPDGAKNFNVVRYEDDTVTEETYGLAAGRLGATGDNSQWGIASGAAGPTTHSNEKVVKFVITVTDPSNNTSDTITVRFEKIKKGAQHKPDEDVNTGLEGTAKTLDGKKPETSLPEAVEKALIAELQAEKDKETGGGTETPNPSPSPSAEPSPSPSTEPATPNKVTRDDLYGSGFVDGCVVGLFSLGQKEEKDSNGTAMTDKTGTYTSYWINHGSLYQMRPLKVGGETLTYADDETGWREVPFRKDKYTKADDLKKVEAAMGYKAATEAITTTNGATVAKVEEKTLTAPWPANYGWIQWNGNLPEIHGFSVGDVVQLRFKANDNYSASEIVPITIGGGGGGVADPSSFATVVCFDWDDTYLGAVIVPKGATAQKVNDELTKYIAGNESFKKALEGKPGYDFTHWVDYSYTGNDGSTAWGTDAITDPTASGKLYSVPQPTEANFDKISANMAVKAAYQINDAYRTTNLTSPTKRLYTFDSKVLYNKMGRTSEYSVTVTMRRLNSNSQGVQRLVKPALKVTTIDKSGGTSYQLIYLDATDTTSASFAVNASLDSFICTVIDVNGVSAWNTGASARSEDLTVKSGTPEDKGFVYYGSLTFVNEQLAPGGDISWVSAAVLRDNLGLNLGSLKIGTARTKLQTAYTDKGGALTIEEMQAALNA